MIAFGCAVSDPDTFERVAMPSIERLAEPDSLLLTRVGCDSIQEPYNEMLAEAGARTDLEALILMHQDLELTDDSLLRRIRPLLRERGTGVIGLLGTRDTMLHRWTSPANVYGRAMTVGFDPEHYSSGAHEVELVDGTLLVLAPWVVRQLRFDEALAEDFHGYDVDLCLRVRARGGRVICDDVPHIHHRLAPWSDRGAVVRAASSLARMWDPALRPRAWAAAFKR